MNFKELNEFSKELQVLEFIKAYDVEKLPKSRFEFAVIGKSNVGKSSLINTLLNYKINKVSKKPGCTRALQFLRLKNFSIVDLPGYGFSSVSKGRQNFFEEMMTKYIKTERINVLFILIDSRRGIQEIDTKVEEAFGCQTFYIYTKIDEKDAFLPKNELGVSIRNGKGIIELRKMITELAK